MNKLLPIFARVLFVLFMFAVGAAVMYYSWNGLALIFPDDLAGQIFGLINFDLAALIWFLAFVYISRSTMQYVFSGFGFLVGLVGTVGLVGIEIGISSGYMHPDDMAQPLTYIMIAVLVSHLVLVYLRHGAEPEVSAGISIGVEKAKVKDEAQKQFDQRMKENAQALGIIEADRLFTDILRDLNVQALESGGYAAMAEPVQEESRVKAPSVFGAALQNFVTGVGSKVPRWRKHQSVVNAPAQVKPVSVVLEDEQSANFTNGAEENPTGGAARVDAASGSSRGAGGGGSMQASPTSREPIGRARK